MALPYTMKRRKRVAWDVKVICSLVEWYLHTSCTPGASAKLATNRKMFRPNRPQRLPNSYHFQPLIFENLGFQTSMNATTVTLIGNLGRKISIKSHEERESTFLFQRLAVTIQRFNSVLLRESFNYADNLDE